MTVGPDEVAITFSAQALLAHGPLGDVARAGSLEWAATLSTMTEVLSDQPGVDLPASGTVADAIPLLRPRPVGVRHPRRGGDQRYGSAIPDDPGLRRPVGPGRGRCAHGLVGDHG